MNNTLRWVTFESTMTALFQVTGISASKFNRFFTNHISILENS